MTIQQLLDKLNLAKTTDKFWVGNGSNPGLAQFAKMGHFKKLLEVLASQPVVDSRPYKVYTAALRQAGTNPVVTPTVLENTIGALTWARTSQGVFELTSGGQNLFTGETVIFYSTVQNGFNRLRDAYKDSDDKIVTRQFNENGLNVDSLFGDPIEIRVYN